MSTTKHRVWRGLFPKKKPRKQPLSTYSPSTYAVKSVKEDSFYKGITCKSIVFCVRVVFTPSHVEIRDVPVLKRLALDWASYMFFEEMKAALGKDKSIGIDMIRNSAYVYVH